MHPTMIDPLDSVQNSWKKPSCFLERNMNFHDHDMFALQMLKNLLAAQPGNSIVSNIGKRLYKGWQRSKTDGATTIQLERLIQKWMERVSNPWFSRFLIFFTIFDESW